MSRKLTRIAPYAAALAFVGLAARLVRFAAVNSSNVLYWDQWDYYQPMFLRFPLWKTFSHAHGPHRQGVGMLFSCALADASAWNSRWDALAIAGLLIAAAALAAIAARKCGMNAAAAWTVSAVVFFNLRQYELFAGVSDLSHGAMPVLLLGFLGLGWFIRNDAVRYALAAGLTFLLIFTGYGLFAGFATPLMLLWDAVRGFREGRRMRAALAVAALAAIALSWGRFIWDYPIATAASDIRSVPVTFASRVWFAGLIGSNFHGVSGHGWRATAFGILFLLGVAAVGAWHARRLFKAGGPSRAPESAVILGLAAFSLLFCITAAAGRIGLGLNEAPATSRYVTLLIPGAMSVLIHLGATLRRPFLAFAYATLVMAGTAALHHHDWEVIDWMRDGRRAWARAYLQTHDQAKADALSGFRVYPRDVLDERLRYLEDRRLNMFNGCKP